MATNHYFQSGRSIGRSSEQFLMEDLTIECLKIYGFDVFYLPRKTVNLDEIFTEDVLNSYEHAYPLEMYLQSVTGFEGEGDLLSKFGVEIKDSATFIVARRRWDEVVARDGNVQLEKRPAEGDIIYFPLTKGYFEIRRVETKEPFYQVGQLYVYKLECELMQYSSERFDTGDGEIDSIDEQSLDIKAYELLLEDGNAFLLEYESTSSVILEGFTMINIDHESQNEAFTADIDILDFTERNPFGEVIA